MSDALDILCLAGGPHGVVLITRGRISVIVDQQRSARKSGWFSRMETRLRCLDVEHHDGRHDRGQAIRALSGRLTPQRRGR